MVQGAYSASYNVASEKNDIQDAMDAVTNFEKEAGRRPRLLVVKMGQDGHDRGAKVESALALTIAFA